MCDIAYRYRIFCLVTKCNNVKFEMNTLTFMFCILKIRNYRIKDILNNHNNQDPNKTSKIYNNSIITTLILMINNDSEKAFIDSKISTHLIYGCCII